ncbi:hypothetical protein N2152v2_000956 [Parachlorella kessleri]
MDVEASPGGLRPPLTSPAADAGTAVDASFSLREFLLFLGPGLLVAVAFMDPGSLQSFIQAGAQTGFALLWWFAIVTLVFAVAFQWMAGRLGLVSGSDLAQLCAAHYPKGARVVLWVLMECAIVGADVQDTVGGGQALGLLSDGRIPLWAGCILASVAAFMLLLADKCRNARWLEAVFGAAIAVLVASMAANFAKAGVPAGDVIKGLFVPSMPKDAMPVAAGALGATVSSYNLFFHSAAVGRRQHKRASEARTRVLLWYHRLETLLTLLLAFLVSLFVICVFAYGFYGNPEYSTAAIGLEDAGHLLGQRFGEQFKYLWAVGVLASGLIATVALTYTGQLVFVGLLQVEVKGWVQFWCTRLVALVPTVLIAVLSDASNSFDRINGLLNVVQSVLLPFALVPLIHLAARPSILGPFSSPATLTAFAALVAASIMAVDGYVLVGFLQDSLAQTPGAYVGWSLLIAAYYLALGYFILEPTPLWAWVCGMWQWWRRRAGGSNAGMDERLGTGATSDGDRPAHASSAAELQNILSNNRQWAEAQVAKDPNFFKKLANELLGLGPGEVFVQRNVGNLATHKDLNCMSCLEYAVNVLKVKHIIVCGHYNCGAVRAALTMPSKTPGLVNLWITDIRDTRDKHVDVLRRLKGDAQVDKLVELNVMRQVFNVCTSPTVQNAWDEGRHLAVHGVVYAVGDGLLRELTSPIMGLEDFERYSHDQMDNLRHLSLSVLESLSFEREALRRGSIDVATAAGKANGDVK